MFDFDATVLDEFETVREGDAAGLLAFDPELEPEDLCADRDGLASDFRAILRFAEDIDDIDRHRNIGQAGVDRLPQNRLPGIRGD